MLHTCFGAHARTGFARMLAGYVVHLCSGILLVCVMSLLGCEATCPAGTTASNGKCVRGGNTGGDGEDSTGMSVEGNPQAGEGGPRTSTGTSGGGGTAGKPGQRTGGSDSSSSKSGAGVKSTSSAQSGGAGGQSGEPASKPGNEGGSSGAAGGGGSPIKNCQVGATRCADGVAEVQVCTSSGNWMSTEVCDGVCSDGACAGVCKPDTLHCGTNQNVEKCNDQGVWTPSETCPNVCSGAGKCTGDCKPGSKRCGGSGMLNEQLCDETGTWQDVRTCPNLCSGGSCSGSCMPSSRQCRTNTTPEECSPMGTWEAEAECPAVCVEGTGKCGGDCKPGLKDCAGQTPTRCDPSGHWVNDAPCVDKACVNGVCGGTCTPGTFRCGPSNAKQRCNERGAWVLDKQCPFACTNNDCSGTCAPGTKMCTSTTALGMCRTDASGYDSMTCMPKKNETASCENNTCKSVCMAPGITCGTQYCYRLDYGCETCKFPNVWREATTGDKVCVVPASRTEANNENNANPRMPCPAGDWVPRMATASDNVCVTPARAATVVAENANAVNTAVVSSGTPP